MDEGRVEFVGGPLDGWWLPYGRDQRVTTGWEIVFGRGTSASARRTGRYVVQEMRGSSAIAKWETFSEG